MCTIPTHSSILALSDEKNERLKTLIQNKVHEYLERAEKLKEHLTKSDEKRSRGAVAANGGGTGGVGGSGKGKKDGDDDDDNDPEVKKLRAGLTSTSLFVAFYSISTTLTRNFQPNRRNRDRNTKYQVGRCCRTRSSQRITQGGCHPTHQVPASLHREAYSMAWNPTIRSTGHGKELSRQGRRNGSQEHILQCQLGRSC